MKDEKDKNKENIMKDENDKNKINKMKDENDNNNKINKMKVENDKNTTNEMKDEKDKNKINKMKDENDKNTTNEMKHENDKNKMNNMNHQKNKNKKNRMKDEKDKNDCTKKMNILKIHHTRWWSHLDQHHHHYLLLLSCLEHLFVSLSLFQRTFIILTSFTFISTLAWPEASVARKVKSINTNSVSDTSNDGNNCLNKKMKKIKDMKVTTMKLAQMKKNETNARELKKKSVVVDCWCLFSCCLTQAIQTLTVDHFMLWSAWLIYFVDSRWWPLVTFLSVSKYYIQDYHTNYHIT
tara:strand:+ start:32 stop:913 length:882 start_codon:yes stop_codon:yes gene_type:complete